MTRCQTLTEYFQAVVDRHAHRDKLVAYSEGMRIGFTDTTTNETITVSLGAIKTYYHVRLFEDPAATGLLFRKDLELAYSGVTPDPVAPPTKWTREELPLPGGNTAVGFTRT
jgi:hypothetical protein